MSSTLGYSITADSETLMRQATATADDYLMHAIEDIDKRLGKGFAKAHPELIAAYMQTSAQDLGTAIIARAIESVARAIGGSGDVYDVAIDHLADHLGAKIEHASTVLAEARARF